MKAGIAAVLGVLLFVAPVQAQSQDVHQHGRQGARSEQAPHAEGQHCPMHAAKHGARSETGASHGAHGSHGAAAQAGAAHAGHGERAAHAGMMAGHGAMMAAHGTAPKMLLKHRDVLSLTPEQVERLEALQAEHKADCERRMAAAKTADDAAATALAGKDLGAYEARLREAAGHRVDCRVDMARLSQAGAALLTDAQRSHLPHLQHASH